MVPLHLWGEEMGIGWQFSVTNPLAESSSWPRFAVELSHLLISVLEQEKGWLSGEVYRQAVELCGRLLNEGLIIFDDRGEVIYQNDLAGELNLYRYFREARELHKLLQSKKETETVWNNSLPVRLHPFHYGRHYLGGAVFTRREKRDLKSA
ncbi:MAG: hypothetical protein ACPLQP_00110, partial [Moorellaceae bacterium]